MTLRATEFSDLSPSTAPSPAQRHRRPASGRDIHLAVPRSSRHAKKLGGRRDRFTASYMRRWGMSIVAVAAIVAAIYLLSKGSGSSPEQ